MKCTHIALQVSNVDRSIEFYRRYCNMHVVQDRVDSFRVVWMGWEDRHPRFVIVLLEKQYEENRQPDLQHIGMSVASREEVDAIYARAAADGSPVMWQPVDAGEIVGYFCGVADPDGNMVEFSYGQELG